MVVYLDLVMALNFLVDGLLLLGTNRLTGYPPGWKRASLAAALGGLYAGACMLPQLQFMGGMLFRILCLAAMSVIAFGWDLSALRRGAIFVLLSMALGGVALGIEGSGFGIVILSGGVVVLLCLLAVREPIGSQRYQPMELVCCGKTLRLTALVDTGNTLRDPISGAVVAVAGADVSQQLGIPRTFVEDPIAGLYSGQLSGARLIPYRAVGSTNGMLLAIRCEKVKLNGREISPIVAFAPQRLESMGAYQVLAGGV